MLAPREREGIRIFWFSTNTPSQKVAAFRENPRASIYFVDRLFPGAAQTRTTVCWNSGRKRADITPVSNRRIFWFQI